MLSARDLVDASRRELADLFARGHRFEPAALAGRTYHGISLGLPAWVERLSWKKFAKAFADDGRRGWNVRLEQNGLDQPWRPLERRGAPVTFGHFDVVHERGAVTLDYGRRGGALRALRDPLVSLRAGSAELLLGRSLLAIAGARVATPSWFVLSLDR